MKQLISVLLSLFMIIGSGITAYADPEEDTPVDIEITEEYQYTNRISSSLSISNYTATCTSIVRGFSGLADKITITQTLQKQNGSSWSYVTSWNKTYNTWLGTFVNTKSSLSSGTYRVKTVAKVYSGSDYETITVYSSTASC